MGKRFLGEKYPLEVYPERRANQILNESSYAYRHMRPYGWDSGSTSSGTSLITGSYESEEL
jgi:hypothetical protein